MWTIIFFGAFYTTIIIVAMAIIFNNLNNKIMASAEETLDAFVTELQSARDAIIARIEAILNDGSDLTAEEVTAKLTGIRDDLRNIGNPPPPSE